MKIRKSQVQALEQSTVEQRNLNSIERTSPSGSVTRIKGRVTIDFASCGAAAVTLQDAALPGTQLGDVVLLSPPAGGLSVAVMCGIGYVTAVNTVRMPVVNPTGGALDPASAVFEYVIFRATPLSA